MKPGIQPENIYPMVIHYIKQVGNLIRKEKLFSWIYIIGTALSVTVVMLLAILLYLRTANIYPENNRNRMLVLKSGMVIADKGGGRSSSALSRQLIEGTLSDVDGVETISVCKGNSGDEITVRISDGTKQYIVKPKYVDDNFWRVFSFDFQDGRPFSREEFAAGIKTVIISESLARKIWGPE